MPPEPAPDAGAHRILEQGRRLGDSLIWRLQARYFAERGPAAWASGEVPHYVTNNPLLAGAYARMTVAFLSDCAAACGPGRPVHVVELGAGSGRFAYQFLRLLGPLHEASAARAVPIRYVITDAAERNLEHCAAHPLLRPFFDSGRLDLARFDVASDDEIVLRSSRERLSAVGDEGPLIVIANYVLDSVPHDAFSIEDGALHELLVTTRAAAGAPEDPGPEALPRLEIAFQREGPVSAPYGDPDWDTILDGQRRQGGDGPFLFPIAALRGVRALHRMAGEPLLLVSADKGRASIGGGADPRALELSVHGSVSVRVGYDAVSRYFRARGGFALDTGDRHGSLCVCAFASGLPPEGGAELRRAYADSVDRFGPDDFFQLKKAFAEGGAPPSARQILALLRLSAWDPEVFATHAEALIARAARTKGALREELGRAVARVAELYFPIGEARDVPAMLGAALLELGHEEDALRWLEQSADLHGPAAENAFNRALCCLRLGRLGDAAALARRALEIDPGLDSARDLVRAADAGRADPSHLSDEGNFLAWNGRLAEARASFEQALALDSEHHDAWNNLGVLDRDEGDPAAALRCYERALRARPQARIPEDNRLMALHYLTDGTPAQVVDEHLAWGRRFPAPPPAPGPAAARVDDPERPLRVGYLSPDFFTHSVSYFIDAALAHSSPRCLSFCYDASPFADEKTAHLRRLAHAWRCVRGVGAADVAEIVRRDAIDVLVDLAGHTAGNRLDVMALRPAPLQMTWIGYPGTTGLPGIDHRITDAHCDPPELTPPGGEAPLRLPLCFLCYTPFGRVPEVAPLAEPGSVTFCSFNHAAKINDRVLVTWSRVLAAVPGARLLLKNKAAASPAAVARLVAALERLGVDGRRVTCLPLAASTSEHLATYRGADVALDTFPYAGTTTTCEALLMGVPVVTLSGACHAQNVGRSLLSAAGLPELVARSEDAYVAIAAGLAAEAPRREALRASLRARFLASPLCDGARFTRDLEAAYRDAWRAHCAR